MRVLLLTSEYPPRVWGGLGRYSARVTAALRRRCRRVDVLCVPTYYRLFAAGGEICPAVEVVEEEGGVAVQVAAEAALAFLTGRGGTPAEAVERVARPVLVAARGALVGRYDLVYAQDYYSAPLAAALLLDGAARRLVSMCHLPLYAGFTYFDKPAADDLHQVLEAALLRLSHRVVVPSRFTRRVLTQIYSLRPERVTVIPEGVAAPGGPGRGAGEEPAGARRPARLLAVARCTEQKGLHYLVEVLATLRAAGLDFELTFIGRGPREGDFEALARRAGVRERVRWHRRVAAEEIFEHYRRADLYLSTSLYETFGLTVLEAMACGCPPLAFHVGALGEVVEHGVSGLLAPVGKAGALARHVLELDGDRRRGGERLARLRAAGARTAAAFSWDAHATALQRLFEECL